MRSTECCGAGVPLPVSVCVAGEFEALLVKVRAALAVPVAFGVKRTVNDADWPARMVSGRLIPDKTNSVLLLLAEDTVTSAPVAFRLPFSEERAPTTTFPKFRLAGDTDN